MSEDYAVYLLDDDVKEIIGEGEGEICIAGCISSGYYNNEEETKKALVKFEEFPLNANGKLDRKALKAPDASQYRVEYEEPHSDVEKKLCEAFENLLKCGKVGINDNFFSLGGNSINVLRLIEETGLSDLTADRILLEKTPKKIAAALFEKKEDYYKDCYEERDFYPLTDSQMGVYLECCENRIVLCTIFLPFTEQKLD